LQINEYDVFRFRRSDASLVRPVVDVDGDGKEVQQGDVIAELDGAVEYLAAEPWHSLTDNRERNNAKPAMDRIHTDGLSATRHRPQLDFAVRSLRSMLDAAEGETFDDFYEYLPEPVYVLRHAEVANRRLLGWSASRTFQASLLLALSADRAYDNEEEPLTVKAPCDGWLTDMDFPKDSRHAVLRFESVHGKVHSLAVPACVVLDDELLEGEGRIPVRRYQVLGDFVPRGFYRTYDQLLSLVGEEMVLVLEDVFFEERLIRSGDTNWRGEGSLAPPWLAGEALIPYAVDVLLDTRPLMDRADEEWGIAVLPPFFAATYANGDLIQCNADGLVLDATPHTGRSRRNERPTKSAGSDLRESTRV
ncbi:MAG: hypothetical protein KDA71_10530, partial [Planctomycetales bacterium]|nr:hypothetical protein [Planctomycetales bacterium]